MADLEKHWLKRGRRRAGYFYLRQRYRAVERLLHRRAPMDGRELVFPDWMVDHTRLARSFHVFKLNAAVGYGSWLLRTRPDARVIQIVRHPGGFLKSWLKRWVRGEGGMARGRANPADPRDLERLRAAARHDPRWAALFGDIEAMDRAENELWWWRWVNETLYAAGQGRPGYTLVRYEELAHEPLSVAQRVYEACGLAWDATITARVRAIASGAEQIAHAWKDELEPELVAVVEKVLHGSAMEQWWSRTEDLRAAA
jgi:hypothetical protein